MHLEDGKLMSFTDSVISNHEHMMGLLADANGKVNLYDELDKRDEAELKHLLQKMSDELRSFLQATSLANDHAYRSMRRRRLFAFTRDLAQRVNAERALLFLVDEENQNLPVHEDIRIPIHSGIVGTVVKNGEPVFVEDADDDSRFNREVDAKTGYRSRSVLALPIRDLEGATCAAVQLLNRKDGQSFTQQDQDQVNDTLTDLSLIQESWVGRHG